MTQVATAAQGTISIPRHDADLSVFDLAASGYSSAIHELTTPIVGIDFPNEIRAKQRAHGVHALRA